MDDFSGQIIYQWKYEHSNPFLVSIFYLLYPFFWKNGKVQPDFQKYNTDKSKKETVL